MALTDTPLSTKEAHSPTNIAATVAKINKIENNIATTTAEVIERVSGLGSKSIIERLEEMEKAMDYLQQQLKENAGCINELGYSFPIQKSGDQCDDSELNSSNNAFLLDHGNGLLPFIQKCLRNEARYFSVIRWTNEQEQEFKIVDPEKFALMWGMEKRKDGMTKRKLTRSLAYLVNSKKRLRRSTTRTFVYQIIPAQHSEDKRSDDSSSCESETSISQSSTPTPQPSFDQPPLLFGTCQQQNTNTSSTNPKYRIPVQALKKMLRENPQHLKMLIDLQNQQNKQQQEFQNQQPQLLLAQIKEEKDAVPTFMMTGSKRSYSSPPTFTADLDQFNNSKMIKMENATSPTCDYMPNFITDINNNVAPNRPSWDMLIDNQNELSAQCSPAGSMTVECNSNYFSQSPLSDCSSVNSFSDSRSTPSYQLTPSLSTTQCESQVTTNFINPVQQSLMVEDSGNLALINPTFCVTEPTFTQTDISAYLTF